MSCACGCGGHDERRAPAPPHNPPGRTALQLRVGEHGTFLAAMLDRLASPAHPALRALTVRTPDDPSIGLLDASAVLGDLLTFHSERFADEGYLGTADDERSLTLLGRLVGHRPRPGVAADTYLAYTVDRDPRGDDPPVLISRGARSNSVPSATEGDPQTFETSRDLTARWSCNRLRVRRRRPGLLTAEDLRTRSELYVAGTANALRSGQKLLFDFGQERLLLPVGEVRVDREEDITAITLPRSPKPTLAELLAELGQWLAPATGEPTPDHPNPRPVSALVDAVEVQLLAPLRSELPGIISPAQLAQRLVAPLERLTEAEVLADPHPRVADWFARLRAMVAELRERALDLAPVAPPPPGPDIPDSPTERLLRALPAREAGETVSRTAPEPRRGAVRHAPPGVLGELLAMRVTATPFGATAPLQPVQDEGGRVLRQTDWPLPGATRTGVRIAMDAAGKELVRAEFQRTEPAGSWQHVESLPAEDVSFDLGAGRVELSSRRETILSRLRPGGGEQRPGVLVRLLPQLPACALFVSRPDEQGRVHVSVRNGAPLELDLAPQEEKTTPFGPYQVTVRYGAGSEPANVEIALSTGADAGGRTALPLDGVHDEIAVGSRVVVERPRKGAPGGVPGDARLAFVVTQVVAVGTMSYAQYGITGRGTVLTLADPWLDEHDTQLSHIRDTTVHAGGQPLRPADEPVEEDLHGNTVELADPHDTLTPGRHIIVAGERADAPARAVEVAVIAEVEHYSDPALPGDHRHTVLTLTEDLAHRYRRDSVVVHGNVVPATHGESRDETIGGGDAARTHQSFTLWQAPLTWLPADNPLGATPSLEIRVDGLLWHAVDSLAGRGPDERVYVTGSTADGRTTVTFGDGVHGARLPTGHENVRARYRFGTGRAANVGADRITQAVTRPLGVTGVTNPLPATGGADADGPALTRRTVPLAVSALDRLVSVRDYEDFARSRAGVGRASARRVFDGRREVLHVTVAGVDDIPIGEDSGVLRSLRAALLKYGDPELPVRVEPRELVLLVVSAKVKLLPDHSWEWAGPRVRRALLDELGHAGRELGQPAHLSEVLVAAQSAPGVSYVDVDVFGGVPAAVSPGQRADSRQVLAAPATTVPARPAEHVEERYRVTDPNGETLTAIAARNGISLTRLLRLNPDITDTGALPPGRTVFVHRGIRPAQLALLAPDIADTLILTEVR
ncbi:putative baseplate assembly protein [Saccharopolyspora aridisoli]|uniref:Putative baseplate assembly protein n=1 Tax=Saccharopolyspora aridisoli TaxID=2530385 RepID=A0A4R4UP41_9PSEU|nr:putative baseplate assembly protein [Saccharopolyspora aridisoli]TDC88599.1 putative baseplate assembly protein [Saccharopolyspora aridisoli]